MFYQIFDSPQVKLWAIITYKDGMHQFPHELPNNLRLRKLGDIRNVSKHHRMIAQCPVPHQNTNFASSSKKVPKNSD